MHEQKTESTHGAVELNLSQKDLTTVTDFTWVSEPVERRNDPRFQPFKSATWQRMRTLLGRVIKAEEPRLWEAANHPTEVGSHEFRRLQMDQIDALEGPNKDARTRALGTNPLMLQKHYKDAKNQSHQRTLQVAENFNSLRLPSTPFPPPVKEEVEGEDGNASSSSEDLLAGYDASA